MFILTDFEKILLVEKKVTRKIEQFKKKYSFLNKKFFSTHFSNY